MTQSNAPVGPESGPVEVWPQSQTISRWQKESVFLAQFEDTAAYHPALIRRVLELERDPELSAEWDRLQGGAKVYHLDRWNCPEADLIQARALAFFKTVFNTETAYLDLSWATIYRDGDSCMPHSHFRTLASLVYFLDFGDSDPNRSANGRFLFVDPRMPMCSRQEKGRMTSPCAPHLREGLLMMFPGQAVHYVNPYRGDTPRITLSWNINDKKLEGTPLPTDAVTK